MVHMNILFATVFWTIGLDLFLGLIHLGLCLTWRTAKVI